MVKSNLFYEVHKQLQDDITEVIKRFSEKIDKVFQENYRYGSDDKWNDYSNLPKSIEKGVKPVFLGFKIAPTKTNELSISLDFYLNEIDLPEKDEEIEE